MPALADFKLERFAQLLLRNVAKGMTRGKAAEAAAKEAGYSGSSVASNARKRAMRADVKARIAELSAPTMEKMEEAVIYDLERAIGRLSGIADAVDLKSAKVPDAIAALRLLAQMNGWMAPEKVEHTINGLGDRLDQALAGSSDPSKTD